MATEAISHVSAARATARPRWLAGALVAAAIALLPLLLSLPFIGEPMEQDEGVYFAVAQQGWPYGEVFDHKPPLVYGWYKAALLLNGGDPSIEAVRVLAALSLSVTALAVLWTGTALFDRRTGIIAGALAGLAATNQYLQFNANSEVFMLAPLALSAAAFVQGWRTQSLRWFALSGALATLAAMTKSVGALQLLALGALPLWGSALQLVQWRHGARASAAVLAAGGLTIAAIVLPFAAAGRSDEFWYANVTFNVAYGAQVGFEDKLFALGEIDRSVVVAGLYLWVPACAGMVMLWRGGASLAAGLIISGAVAAFAGASMTGREYPHYLVPLLPFAALAAGHAFARMAASWDSARSRLHHEALLLALVVPAIFAIVPLYVLDVHEAHLRKYHHGPNSLRAIENEAVAARVRAITSPPAPLRMRGDGEGDQTLFVLGDEAQLYALSGLEPATHHIRPVSDAAVDRDTLERTKQELEARPPAVVVDSGAMEMGVGLLGREGQTVTLDIPAADRAWFDTFLRARYEMADTVGHAEIWLLRSEADDAR